MAKHKPRHNHNHPDLFVPLPSISAGGETVLASPVKNSFKQVDLEIVTAEEMPFDLIQYIAVHMDEIAADFAL
jgi:hypothetical protein